MVELHRSAVAALHDDPAAALAAAERAQAGFAAAGDLAAAQLAAAHAALAGVQAGAWPERDDVASRIGAWGRESGAVGWALGIGMLFSQAGWRWLRRDADPDRALACHRLADATFTALDEPAFAQQTLADRAIAHDTAGNGDAARVAVDAATRSFPELPPRHPGWADELELREGELANLARTFAYGGRDPDLLERVQPGLDRFRARIDAAGRGEGLEGMPAELRDPLMSQAARTARERGRPRVGPRVRSALPRARRSPAEPAAVRRAVADRARDRGEPARRAARPAGGEPPARDRRPRPSASGTRRPPPAGARPVRSPSARRRRRSWPQRSRTGNGRGAATRRSTRSGRTGGPGGQAVGRARRARPHNRRPGGPCPGPQPLRGCDRPRDPAQPRRSAARPQPAASLGAVRGRRPSRSCGVERRARRRRRAGARRARTSSGLLSHMARSAALAGAIAQHTDEFRDWRELTARIEMLTWMEAGGRGDHAEEIGRAEGDLAALEAGFRTRTPGGCRPSTRRRRR